MYCDEILADVSLLNDEYVVCLLKTMFEMNFLIVVLNSSIHNTIHHSITTTIPIIIITIYNKNQILTRAVAVLYLPLAYNSPLQIR